ncbi:hypothetical protein ACIRS1_37700 [Kitasatospora sp. NPDC101176]|uniref:hypothetical protein n=1 Tax=Kitasatospora sp. NPDC101176 TaxID=3364099 RepID=UPI0037F7D93A
MKKPYWQPSWYRLLFRADGGSGWEVMGPPPVSRVPNAALANGSLEAWVQALLAGAVEELDDLRGELLIECFDGPEPAEGAQPVHSARIRLPGPTAGPSAPRRRARRRPGAGRSG